MMTDTRQLAHQRHGRTAVRASRTRNTIAGNRWHEQNTQMEKTGTWTVILPERVEIMDLVRRFRAGIFDGKKPGGSGRAAALSSH
jgi:hypothetical protein